jgi:hypothetical protein
MARLDTIEGAIEFATRAHDGQVDKQGAPYILHPLRVGARLYDYGHDYVIAGLLHDVVEDTPHTFDDLRTLGASPAVVDAVASVTKTESERGWGAYRVALDRAGTNEIGGWVKASDIADNYGRIDGIQDPAVRARLTDKYEKAVPYLAGLGFDPVRFM